MSQPVCQQNICGKEKGGLLQASYQSESVYSIVKHVTVTRSKYLWCCESLSQKKYVNTCKGFRFPYFFHMCSKYTTHITMVSISRSSFTMDSMICGHHILYKAKHKNNYCIVFCEYYKHGQVVLKYYHMIFCVAVCKEANTVGHLPPTSATTASNSKHACVGVVAKNEPVCATETSLNQ